MGKMYYIASCVFTSGFPELSKKIQEHVEKRYDAEIVRCCVPNYRLKDFEDKMPEGELRALWSALPDSGAFEAGDEVYSLCHNCNNIIEEMKPGVKVRSLWELLDGDDELMLPDHSGLTASVQDCWRAKDRACEQDAVRSLLRKMNIEIVELPENRDKTMFCGKSLYRPQPPRNPKLAPKHYVEGAKGLFVPHTEDEQNRLMEEYCAGIKTDTVVCYCHYCLEGLLAGGKDARHIAQLIFG